MAERGEVRNAFPDLPGEEKLKELILYIAEKSALDPYFGAVKLNKILHYSDIVSYGLYGEPITGVEYAALEQGPGPKRLVQIKRDMLRRGEIKEEERPVGIEHVQRRIVPQIKADLLKFNGREIAVVDSVIQALWKLTATQVSRESHTRAWRIARKHSLPIPYEAVFLSSDETASASDIARAKVLAGEYGWKL